MKVFIGWSGNNSKKLGEALRDWIPSVLQAVKPYFTPSDIEKGARWNSEIASELETSEVGILCVTRDCIHSDWIMFEAGALAKSLEKSRVCPVLFNVQNTDLAGPLKQFQTTEFKKEDIKKLISLMNGRLGDGKLTPKALETVFEKWWPDLQTLVAKILEDMIDVSPKPIRPDRELIEEILELSRIAASQAARRSSPIHPGALDRILQEFIGIHNENQAETGSYQNTLDHLAAMKTAIEHIFSHTQTVAKRKKEFDALTFRTQENEPCEEDKIPF